MSKGIIYKDVRAMPGSMLHKLLSEGKRREAEAQYQDINRRHEALLSKDTPSSKDTRNEAHHKN